MPANLSIETFIEKNLSSSSVAFLLAVEVMIRNPDTWIFEETLRFVKNSEDFVYRGQTFYKADFDLTIKSEANELPSVSIEVVDLENLLQDRMQAYGGGVGSMVRVIVINSGASAPEPALETTYSIISASAQGQHIKWQLGMENPGLLRCPKRMQMRDRCQWRYKSAECGYTGSILNCDLTLQGPNGCNVHGNSENFGAFPGLNSR